MRINEKLLDAQLTMYPSYAQSWSHEDARRLKFDKTSTYYGYVHSGTACLEDEQGKTRFMLAEGMFFCFTVDSPMCGFMDAPISSDFSASAFVRMGYRGQNVIGYVEPQGRLTYIDGCSDSLIVYPPRKGDPSLNLLYFPPAIVQSIHTHPSIRLGCVIEGSGWANTVSGPVELSTGSIFLLDERESHGFCTEKESMTVVAFHPDGDWGPEDHNHTMLNRTYLR